MTEERCFKHDTELMMAHLIKTVNCREDYYKEEREAEDEQQEEEEDEGEEEEEEEEEFLR